MERILEDDIDISVTDINFCVFVGPISKIREVRVGEKDYSKRLDPFDVSRQIFIHPTCRDVLLYM